MARPWTVYEVEQLKKLYLDQGKPWKVIGEKIGRTSRSCQLKASKLGWIKLKKIADGVPDEISKLPKDQEVAVAEKSSTLAKEFVAEVSERAARAASTGFDLFEECAKSGDLDGAETSIKIAERASNMARKSMDLDKASGGGDQKTFNVFFAKGVKITKVEEAEDTDDAIDL